MTVIRWTQPASDDLLGIVEWVKARSPTAAARVGREILRVVQLLDEHPYLGKPGRSPDTRELVVARYPYLIVYTAVPGAMASEPSQVAILRILHGAMLWPSDEDAEPR